jgi:hypothetical protein
MSKLKVIGITGLKQTGKSTFARYLHDIINADPVIIPETGVHKWSAERYAFAKPLKEICHTLFGGTEDNWYGDFKTVPLAQWADINLPVQPTPRKLLQYVGTELFRNHVNPEFWLHVAHRYIADIVEETGANVIIIDDVRFDNEATFLLQHYDAVIVKLTRHDPGYKSDGDLHQSEKGLSTNLVDFVYSFDDYENHLSYATDLLRNRMGLIK